MKLLKQANWLLFNKSFLFKFAKKAVVTAFFFTISVYSFSQNLVSNSGFDSIYVYCPLFNGISNVKDWYSIGSVDAYHYCGNQVQPAAAIPKNSNGYQFPISDSLYLGITFYATQNFVPWTPVYREYLSARLNGKLKPYFTYCVEFYVSLADTMDYAISSIGAFFSSDSLYSSCSGCPIYRTPQIQNDSLKIITDKKNWTKISGSFIAFGNEQFINIGNFYNDTFTERHYQKVSNNNITNRSNTAYYYIDNVSVYACDSPLVEEPQDTTFVFIPNVFSPNQDGENDLWEVTASKVSSLNIQVFNRWGEQVYKTNLINEEEPTNFNPAWDGYTYTGKPAPEGTYFYIVQYTLPSGETKVEKGHLTLLR